ncbi:MAG: response regulator transcription factor [Nocardioidaceae bacterium]|nr:response regulator transcription factor [Nocardioidaceae bacterium]
MTMLQQAPATVHVYLLDDGVVQVQGADSDTVVRAFEGEGIHVEVHEPGLLRVSAGLTERETEVLRLIATGITNDQIADVLFLSVNTVKSYIRSAYRKIDATTRVQAVGWAREHGLAPASRWPITG